MKKLVLCAAVIAAAFLGAATGNARAAGTCVSDGTSSDANYQLVCFTGCAIGDPDQLWHVSVADFDADVQAIASLEQCSGWYLFDSAPTTTTTTHGAKSGQTPTGTSSGGP